MLTVKLRLPAVFDAQHGGFATGLGPVSWGSIDELFVNLTVPRPLLLAVAGGEPPDPTPVRGNAAADLGAPGPGRLTRGECKDASLAKTKTQVRSGVYGMSWEPRAPGPPHVSAGCVAASEPGRRWDEEDSRGRCGFRV